MSLKQKISEKTQEERDKNLNVLIDVEKSGYARGISLRRMEEIKEEDDEDGSYEFSKYHETKSQGDVSFESSRARARKVRLEDQNYHQKKNLNVMAT